MDITVRERIEKTEEATLSPRATLSKNSEGREGPEEPCDIRTEFQRDRDRIIHCTSFRRLKHKTQVFLAPEGDHYRTRLTHTIEVTQIARTIARALNLNEDLTEAIAFGHDIGHTPFGHAGERALDKLCESGFRHYENGVRVCSRIEKGGKGLNLTKEVLDGILHHTHIEDPAKTLEGRIVYYADKIAYINHDTDDAVRAGRIKVEDIPKDVVEILGSRRSQRINRLVMSVVNNTVGADIRMDEEAFYAYKKLHDFLNANVYRDEMGLKQDEKVYSIMEKLFEYFTKNPEKLPRDMQNIREAEGLNRAVTDYIAGMTDGYAIRVFEEAYIPKTWQLQL